MSKRSDHVVMLPGDGTPFARVKCEHCGNTAELRLPAGIRTWAGWARGYVADHRHCKPRAHFPTGEGFAELCKPAPVDPKPRAHDPTLEPCGVCGTSVAECNDGRGGMCCPGCTHR
jgi:hypothetical protein